jgi:hypothetical protein
MSRSGRVLGHRAAPVRVLRMRLPLGKEETLRTMLCCCCHLEADDEHLHEVIRDHLQREHLALPFDEERIREIVAAHAYDLEYAAVYAGGTAPDEEFGAEPY